MHLIKTKKQFTKILNQNITNNIVIHYKCAICQNKQTTDEEEAADILESFEKYEYIISGYYCDSCGMSIKKIYVENIFAIEIM